MLVANNSQFSVYSGMPRSFGRAMSIHILPKHMAGTEAGLIALATGQRRLLWTFRLVASGRGGCPFVERLYSDHIGPDGVQGLLPLIRLAYARLVSGVRRPLRFGYPGAAEVSADERAVLAAITAAQAKDIDRLEAHLRWLLPLEVRDQVGQTLCTLAAALTDRGLRLEVVS
jgi:hypothetical protein